MKKIILTGGGTAGHVTPNIALLPKLQKEGFEIHYIGSRNGMEKKIIEDLGIKYYGISSGKLRRYMDIKNFTDAFRIVKGLAEAILLINKIKPNIVFSKGGFVTVPVIMGASFKKVPVIIHESDITPGLANKIAMPFSKVVCTSFPETVKSIPKGKGICTGSPIREELLTGKKENGLKICGFHKEKPVIMVMGGSLGSVKMNHFVRECLEELLLKFQIIHLCGKGNIDENLKNKKGYIQFEYISNELPHMMQASEIIISRAGSNSIFEFLVLEKPSILIPLSKNASRGDQILNAESFQKQGFCEVIEEENLDSQGLLKQIENVYNNRETYKEKMKNASTSKGVDEIMNIIRKNINK